MNDMSNPFISSVGTGIEDAAKKDGNATQLADAAGNSQTQITQIENFITMKVDAIFIFAVDPTALTDVVAKAKAAGIKILTAGGSVEGADLVMNVDQAEWGKHSAKMFNTWATTTFGADAKGKKVLVLKVTDTDQAALRSNGIEEQLKADGYTTVAASTECKTAADGQTAVENLWQQNSDAIGIVSYDADAASGANEFIMSQNGVDKAKFGIFACDTSDEIKKLIDQSKDNSSVFRGTVGIGGPTIDGSVGELPAGTYLLLTRLVKGEDSGYTGDSTVEVTAE